MEISVNQNKKKALFKKLVIWILRNAGLWGAEFDVVGKPVFVP